MHGDLLLIALALVLGCAAFIIGTVYFVVRLMASAVRRLFGWPRPRAVTSGSFLVGLRRGRICRHDRCRRVEYREARFCSQCGGSLGNDVKRGIRAQRPSSLW